MAHLDYFLLPERLVRLRQQLAAMQQTDQAAQTNPNTGINALLATGIPVLALASTADRIVPQTLTEQCFPPSVQPGFEPGFKPVTPPDHHITLHYHAGRSHCLPLSAPLWCAEAIMTWLSPLVMATGDRHRYHKQSHKQSHHKCV